MNFLASPAPFTDSLPADGHLLHYVVNGWRVDLVHFLQFGLPQLLFALLMAFLVQQVVLFFVRRLRSRANALVGNATRAAQLRTTAGIIRATAYALIAFYLLTQVLGAIGVSLGPFIASAGVIGLGISFGAQSIFKDMLTGIFILVEDQYSVGDTIKIAGFTGTVEDLSLRITRLRDGDGTLHIVPNSQITSVSNLSRDFAVGTLNLSVDARQDPTRIIEVLTRLATDIRHDTAFKDIVLADPAIPGVDALRGYEAVYPITIRVRINQRDAVLRELRKRILTAFANENIALATTTSTLMIEPTAVNSQTL